MPPPNPDITELAANLIAALTTWAGRDDTGPQPEVRRAGGTAIDLIDLMLTGLYATRQQLVGEIFESDRASERRCDALLAEIRERRQLTTTTTGA